MHSGGGSDGFCIEGPLPPPECIRSLQRYQLRVGDAFTVLGDSSGFLHNRVRDADGACIDSPAPDPLKIGRLPLTAPACDSTTPSPNPCSLTVDHSEKVDLYQPSETGDTCVL